MEIINENTTLTLLMAFEDEEEAAVIPTSVEYRIDDVASGDEILDWTTFTPSAATHNLVITAAQNAILDGTLAKEKKRVSFKVAYGIDKEATDEYIYAVRNLTKIT
jgi:hypothetical protein